MIRHLLAWLLRHFTDTDDEILLRSSLGRDLFSSDASGCAIIMRNNARRERARELLRPRFPSSPP